MHGMPRPYEGLEARLQIDFTDRGLLEQALTHRSYAADVEGATSNERLEFLGDTVLDLIIAEELYFANPDWPEGDLTKAKASAVGERSLERIAHAWDLGAYVRLSRGEEASGGRQRRALLADAVEAIFGAYYLDQGLDACRTLVLREMTFILETIERRAQSGDYKTQLQEVLQARFQAAPSYVMLEESGPPHDRTFRVAVQFQDDVLGVGVGKSKKEAEQQAASCALASPFIAACQ